MVKTFWAIITDTNGEEYVIDIPESAGCDNKKDAGAYILNADGLYTTDGDMVIIPSAHVVSILIKGS